MITFVNRNLSPIAGYHIFMRLAEITAPAPQCAGVAGGATMSVMAPADNGRKWKDIFYRRSARPDQRRRLGARAFSGQCALSHFIPLLQLSTVHAHLTYPFCAELELLEAMSVGCAIVASDLPLHETIRHDETGRLVDF